MVPEPIRDTSIDSLSPEFRIKFDLWRAEVKAKYPNADVFETRRNQSRQNWLYAQWRSRAGKIVTNTLQSNHKAGNAVDIVFTVNHAPTRQWPYEELWQMARKYGIVWWGDRRAKDLAHFEDDGKPYKKETLSSTEKIIMTFYKEIWDTEVSKLPEDQRVFKSPEAALERIKWLSEEEKLSELLYLMATLLQRVKK